jgi:hypothetical protein
MQFVGRQQFLGESKKVSSLMIAGTGISIQSIRDRTRLALLRVTTPPRKRNGRVTRRRGLISVLPKQAVPL